MRVVRKIGEHSGKGMRRMCLKSLSKGREADTLIGALSTSSMHAGAGVCQWRTVGDGCGIKWSEAF